MENFSVTKNPDGTLTPNWVDGEDQILITVQLMEIIIRNYNSSIQHRKQFANWLKEQRVPQILNPGAVDFAAWRDYLADEITKGAF